MSSLLFVPDFKSDVGHARNSMLWDVVCTAVASRCRMQKVPVVAQWDVCNIGYPFVRSPDTGIAVAGMPAPEQLALLVSDSVSGYTPLHEVGQGRPQVSWCSLDI